MGGSGGGSSTTTTVDYEYNSRMAAIAEEQQAMAQELYQYWKSGPGHWESSGASTSSGNVTGTAGKIVGYKNVGGVNWPVYSEDGATTSSGSGKWVSDPGAVSLMQQEQAQIRANLKLIPKQTDVSLEFYGEAMNGIDVQDRVNQAQADVSGAYAGADQSLRRWASKYGINPKSGAFLSQANQVERSKAAGLAGAATNARTTAEDEKFKRLAAAMGTIGG